MKQYWNELDHIPIGDRHWFLSSQELIMPRDRERNIKRLLSTCLTMIQSMSWEGLSSEWQIGCLRMLDSMDQLSNELNQL
jgi:hypothetical protein